MFADCIDGNLMCSLEDRIALYCGGALNVGGLVNLCKGCVALFHNMVMAAPSDRKCGESGTLH